MSAHLRVEDVGAHAQLAARLLGDGRLVARDHLHLYTLQIAQRKVG